jgi:heme/copper-type cytochrome/quinol oxidase subunit 2
VICTQLCGYGHSTMRTTLHIITAASFNTFLAEHGYSGPTAQTASVNTSAVHRTAVVAAASGWTSYAPLSRTKTTTKEGTQ